MPAVGIVRPSDHDLRGGLYGQNSHQKSVRTLCTSIPLSMANTVGGATSGTGGATNIWSLDGKYFEQFVIGTQTIAAPIWATGGVDWSGDQTQNDGWEVTNGIAAGQCLPIFTIGTDKPFYFSFTVKLSVASSSSDFKLGFRGVEAYQAASSSYQDVASLGTTSNDAKIKEYTIKTGGTPTNTDSTQTITAATATTFTVIVDSDGSLGNLGGQNPPVQPASSTVGTVYYEIQGAEPTAKATSIYKFTSGLVVVPFIHYVQNATPGTLIPSLWEVGTIGVGQTAQLATQQ